MKDSRKNLVIGLAIALSVLGMIGVFYFWNSDFFDKCFLPTANNVPSNPTIKQEEKSTEQYPLHKNIITTTFWVGEEATQDNRNISNLPSAWDEEWMDNFGGVDDPEKRNGFYPADFIPKENPFYFALPYNDLDSDGERKKDAVKIVYWADEKIWNKDQSMLKNRWIKIIKDDKVAYAQWEDVGPFGEDDGDYVFGTKAPRSQENNNAGLDVSPAVTDYLNLDGEESVDWQFVKESDVPEGPWKDIITTF